MLLRYLIVILVMLNLGVGAWWLLHAPVRAAGSETVVAEGPGLRLLDEAVPEAVVPAVRPAQQGSTGPVPPVGAPSPADRPASEPQVAAAARVCVRFGPFADSAARELARNSLARVGVHGLNRDSPARSARGWKVSVPPLASREDAVAMAERLRAAGVRDLYVMNEGEDANSIALGRYGGEEAARRREADLRSKGFAALASPLGDVPVQAWLDARLPDGVEAAGLARIAPSRALDCATLR